MADEIETRERRRWQAAEATWALWEVLRAADDAGHVLAQRLGLPDNDVRAMSLLVESEAPLGPVELGNRLGMRSASATELVDRLEGAGHVRRVRHPRDRRRVVVEVTESGRSAVLAELGPLLARFDRVAEELGAEGSATVVSYLRAIAGEQRAFGTRGSSGGRRDRAPGTS
ncbi:MarR family transcriptional regulator [Pseudonocardia kunmingensis]|uniref:DNA-binding MarR family transcriptional regulator n=1 Tax=Pseudonocardia kunmingensis TaxID=630975 RepID=A0A543DXL2_9PSEU|nr:MarR family transcriptional regulator [Pseudonocardia kunmingensis]TQM13999.1 DNA-binding MarR family transcriptional regulator [Pseudonocardia kunmingensis]